MVTTLMIWSGCQANRLANSPNPRYRGVRSETNNAKEPP